jgi:short-subunit dehydrogenase
MNAIDPRPLAVVTGASSGIGFHLARCCAAGGLDLIIAADRPLDDVANDFRMEGAKVTIVHADLATQQGLDDLCEAIGNRPVNALLANAGHGLGKSFLEQNFQEIEHVIDTNITGTLYLLHRIARGMLHRNEGKILITGSIAGFIPGSFQAVYNGTKAFIDSFAPALRNELKNTGVTVTCLLPGPTDTEFFARAGMLDTKLATDEKADPAKVARLGFEAMMNDEADAVAGLKNKLHALLSKLTPSDVAAENHRRIAEPGSAEGCDSYNQAT